jgi:hypothetical protein
VLARALVVGLLGAAAVVASPASPSVAASGVTKFGNLHSGRCLEVLGARTDDFAPVGQFDCHGGPGQQWGYNTSTGVIQNINSGKCLGLLHGNTANGAAVVQLDCANNLQRWVLSSLGLVGNQQAGKCLEILGWRTDNSAPAALWECHGGNNQKWRWN